MVPTVNFLHKTTILKSYHFKTAQNEREKIVQTNSIYKSISMNCILYITHYTQTFQTIAFQSIFPLFSLNTSNACVLQLLLLLLIFAYICIHKLHTRIYIIHYNNQ